MWPYNGFIRLYPGTPHLSIDPFILILSFGNYWMFFSIWNFLFGSWIVIIIILYHYTSLSSLIPLISCGREIKIFFNASFPKLYSQLVNKSCQFCIWNVSLVHTHYYHCKTWRLFQLHFQYSSSGVNKQLAADCIQPANYFGLFKFYWNIVMFIC